MANLLFLGIELLAAAMLLLLWFQDRTRRYLLWWTAAQAMLPCLSAAGTFLRHAPASGDVWGVALFLILTTTTCAVCQIQGTLLYRGIAISRRVLALTTCALLAVQLATLMAEDLRFTRLLAVLLLTSSLVATSALLWPLGLFERVTAIVIAARAALAGAASVAVAQAASPQILAAMTDISVLSTVASALAIVAMVFNRLLADLREQATFQTLSKDIVTALQGLMDEREMARRVIDLFISHPMWDSGALVLHEPGRDDFEVVYVAGPQLQHRRLQRLNFDGLAGLAFTSRRLTYSRDAARDARVPETLRSAARDAGAAAQICIPLVHDDVTLGVLILRDRKIRELLPHEIDLMESLGKVVGMSLMHLRNLATMAYRAMHDALTGLDNRAALHEWFNGRDAQQPATLMLFDLNGFKEVNDALGHSVGDELLQALSSRLQQSLAGARIRVFRLGGDEFVIAYDDALAGDANAQRAQQLAELIARPFDIGGVCLQTSASIGIAEAPRHATSSHDLLRCADLAMYQAKHNDWPFAFYEQGRQEDVRDRIQLVSGVLDGLERDEFFLHYQPFIDLSDGSCNGCEALVRWHHPERGLLGAGAFMPFVEATDLIHPLTLRVAELAIREAGIWHAHGMPLNVSINLSARNLLDANLPEQLLRLTREHRLDPAHLQLEITETALMNDPVSAATILQRLHDAGFTIGLDDFGTGYSSLAYLARFPIDTLKIDQGFVRNMVSDLRSRSIVQSTVELAHMLDLSVTAEGIEGEAEAKLLTQFGCDSGQGYFYARPRPREEFERWWRAEHGRNAAVVPD